MSEIKVNKISPRSGTAFTLGDSGDTFTIPSGATINNQGTAVNFGATGSASWVTTVKTSTFTAVAGEGYFVNTTGGVVTVNLPAGTAGAVVAIKDYAGTFDTNKVTVVQNGSDKIGGSAVNATLNTEGIAVTLVFIDSTQGWLVTDSGLQNEASTATYVVATGGTSTQSGDYEIRTFTSPGTFQITALATAPANNNIDWLVVGGGGGGSKGGGSNAAGGGGAGGFRESPGTATGGYTASPIAGGAAVTGTITSYPIVVGAGGGCTASGSNSSGLSIISTGGGNAGGATGGPTGAGGGAGGSGGGAGGGAINTSGGAGNTPPVSPSQGFAGGNSPACAPDNKAGGGGGAGEAGVQGSPSGSGRGAVGQPTSINGSGTSFSGGGAGSSSPAAAVGAGSPCGTGGCGSSPNPVAAGTTNRGGGGGGNCSGGPGGSGGSGIVVIRYKFQN